MTQPLPAFAHPPSTIRLGDLEVVRLGYGAMRLPGPEVWGEPEDPARARDVLRRVIALGINLIDSAWFYGPHVSNRLIAETLYPYPRDLVIASKLGGKRLPDKGWAPFCRPDELRTGCETDLRELRREVLDVVHLRFMGKASPVPFAESLDAMIDLKKEGKIRHLALSNVGPGELEFALTRTPIVSVQNLYSVSGGAGAMHLLRDVQVEITLEIGRRRMRIADVLKLSTGQTLELAKAAGEPLDIFVNGKLLGRGEAVVVGDRYGVRITEIVAPVGGDHS